MNEDDKRVDEADRAAGRRLLVAIEWLGEVLHACEEVPTPLRGRVAAIAEGKSRVPADGERIDFVGRVRESLEVPVAEGPGAPARSLRSWLGAPLTAWLVARIDALPVSALGLALRAPVERCAEARTALRARHSDAAEAFFAWYAAGVDGVSRQAFAAASAVALDEAIDRWCALGCESDLRRYVVTWQRSASGWAEAHLGTRVAVDVGDLGRLRAAQSHLEELRSLRAPRRSLPRALAARLGVTEAEASRLLAVHAEVRARRDPTVLLQRRWGVLQPIARAVAALETELGRAPAVSEIAARAAVHTCLVELALEAMEDL